MQWKCPVCHHVLQLNAQGARCCHQHGYDRARQGYLNLLLANQKHSKSPGDNNDMLLSRQRFLATDAYRVLSQGLASTLINLVDERSSLQVLDMGCGEGYFTQQMADSLRLVCPFVEVAGSDISRDAIKLAAKSYPQLQFVVASSQRLPVMDDSLDVVVRNFSPSNDQELHRVLRDDGHLLIAAPADNHLQELKQQLYDDVRRHQAPSIPEGFQQQQLQRYSDTLVLEDKALIADLLHMTPFAWRGKAEGRQWLMQQEQLTITLDFFVGVYTKEVLP